MQQQQGRMFATLEAELVTPVDRLTQLPTSGFTAAWITLAAGSTIDCLLFCCVGGHFRLPVLSRRCVSCCAGLEEELLPHFFCLDSEARTAEERRLFYVGMTRAKERLCLSWTRWRWQWTAWCGRLSSAKPC